MSVEKFEVILNNSREIWLGDHRILGKCIFPAAGYIELVIANLDVPDHRDDQAPGVQFERFKILTPLVFDPAEDKKIEIELPPVDSPEPFRVKTKNPQGNWDIHVEGYIKSSSAEKTRRLNIEEIKSRCSHRFAGPEYYSLYRQAGVEYGPFFQSVQYLHWNESEVLSEMRLTDTGSAAGDLFYLHPAFLDGAFQSVGVFPFFAERKLLYLPFYIDQIVVYGSLPDPCFCYGRASKKANTTSAADLLKFDISFCNGAGEVRLEIRGFCLKALPPPKSSRSEDAPAKMEYRAEDIAVIGMAGRFPGAADLEGFWQNLADGVPAVSEIPGERWPVERFYDQDGSAPGKTNCRYGCFLTDIDRFDPMFFGISVNKAKYMDPQQRLMLETAFQTVEDAAYGNNLLARTRTGVYVGVSHNEYIHLGDRGVHQVLSHVASGNTFSAIANRISYFLDLTGPSIAVDTACSSSLVALYYAVQDINRGECDYALVGGVNLTLSPSTHIIFSQLGVLSADGLCRPFDKEAGGYVRGEGVGAVLLKSLNQALTDRDNIHAVIRGIALAHTGATNGFNSPSAVSETSVILDAYRRAGVTAEDISYIESHGTGTKLGDQIEFRGLVGAFKKHTSKRGFCALGSIKANIGHLEPAAGIASVIKTILALKSQKIPPMLNFATANDKIDFNQSPFFVNDRLIDWNHQSGPRRAGVSTFGFGGSNVHLVLEEFCRSAEQSENHKHNCLLTLSTRSSATVKRMIEQVIRALGRAPDSSLHDICGTLNAGRHHHDKFRLAVLADSREDLIKKLSRCLEGKGIPQGVFVSGDNEKKAKIAFLFGPDYPIRSWQEFRNEPAFVRRFGDWPGDDSLASFLYGFSLSEVLQTYGIKPQVVGGIGVGEIIAAVASGCLSLEEALTMVSKGESPAKLAQSKIPFLWEEGGTFHVQPAFHEKPPPLPSAKSYSVEAAKSWLGENEYSVIVEPSKIQSMSDLDSLVARLYAKGINIDWHGYYEGDPFYRISLPTYPFKRTRYWMDG